MPTSFAYTLLLLTLSAYAVTSGFKDAILYSRTGAEAFRWNEHVIFTVERLLVVITLLLGTQVTDRHSRYRRYHRLALGVLLPA